jgi:hypothetical protein
MAAASHWTTIRPMAVMTVNVAVEASEFGQGETDDNPRPAPNASNTRVIDTLANAPEKIAAQLTADCEDSLAAVPPLSRLCLALGPRFNARSEQEE